MNLVSGLLKIEWREKRGNFRDFGVLGDRFRMELFKIEGIKGLKKLLLLRLFWILFCGNDR